MNLKLKTLIPLLFIYNSNMAAQAQMDHEHMGMANNDCPEISVRCATSVTPIFDKQDHLWIIARANNRIFVAHSDDEGAHFDNPRLISPDHIILDSGPDERPKIVLTQEGYIVTAYAIFRDEHYTGAIYTSRSIDAGQSFTEPKLISQVQEGQRFEGLAIDSHGDIFAAWLDKRNRLPFKEKGLPFPGASLAFSWSRNSGESFGDSKIAFDNTCECCRLAIDFIEAGRPVVLFRNIYDYKVRDHAITTFIDPETPGELHRVSDDDWNINACPHHGPTLTISHNGTYHAAWFTQGNNRKGVYYSYSRDQGKTFSNPVKIGHDNTTQSRPYLLADNNNIYLAWKEFDGEKSSIFLMISHDDGDNWEKEIRLKSTSNNSDHPMLLMSSKNIYLSWQTHDEGYSLTKIGVRHD
jgi:hypothetical protein